MPERVDLTLPLGCQEIAYPLPQRLINMMVWRIRGEVAPRRNWEEFDNQWQCREKVARDLIRMIGEGLVAGSYDDIYFDTTRYGDNLDHSESGRMPTREQLRQSLKNLKQDRYVFISSQRLSKKIDPGDDSIFVEPAYKPLIPTLSRKLPNGKMRILDMDVVGMLVNAGHREVLEMEKGHKPNITDSMVHQAITSLVLGYHDLLFAQIHPERGVFSQEEVNSALYWLHSF